MKKILLLLMLLSAGYIQAQSVQKSRLAKLNSGNHTGFVQKSGIINHVQGSLFSDNMDGDNTVAGLTARGYATYFRGTGGPGLAQEWIQGDILAFNSYNGPDTGYVASTFQSVTTTNDIDNWLVLPALALTTTDSLSFYCTTELGSTFADSVRVMYNPTGATLPEDLNWVELDRFFVPPTAVWTRYAYAVPTASTTGTFAIRHAVADGGPDGVNSDYVGIDQIDVFDTTAVVVVFTDDNCMGANDINTLFGQPLGIEQVAGPFDNTTATTDPSEPTTGFECWGEPDGGGAAPEINNSLWFTFVGDGSNYFVETGTCAGVTNYISDGDTQFALYSGPCNALVPVQCNEDGPSATATTYPAGFSFGTVLGQTYYLMVDGFSFNGVHSVGQFCVKVTKLQSIGCSDPSVTLGTSTQSVTNVCFGDTLSVSAIGAVAPNAGAFNGIGWLISSGDLTGNTDPLNDPSFITSYTFVSPAPDTLTRILINDGTLTPLAGGGIFYWTPVIFGNATGNVATPQFVQDLTLDPTCTTTGTSLAFNILLAGDPLCTSVGINENNPQLAYGIKNIYPIPVNNDLNFTISAQESSDLVISIKDNLGKEVSNKSIHAVKGDNKISFNLSGKAAGFYFINVSGNKGNYNVKFIKN